MIRLNQRCAFSLPGVADLLLSLLTHALYSFRNLVLYGLPVGQNGIIQGGDQSIWLHRTIRQAEAVPGCTYPGNFLCTHVPHDVSRMKLFSLRVFRYKTSHSVAQVAVCRLLNTEVRTQSQSFACGFCYRNTVTRQGFSENMGFFFTPARYQIASVTYKFVCRSGHG